MNKDILKKFFLISGIIISLFSIFFDFILKNNFYFGASQLILLLFGISLTLAYRYNKIFICTVGIIIGLNIVIYNKKYFGIINESPIIKKKIEEVDKSVVSSILDKRFKELEKFIELSNSYIDQNQFQKYFAYKNNNNFVFKKKKNLSKENNDLIKTNVKLIKNRIQQDFLLNFHDILSQKLDVKILKEIKYEKYTVIVFEWNAINGNKAIGNIYVPKNLDKKLPIVFSVPGCGENLWTDYPDRTNPQHRMGLLATNQIVSATTIATCSNSNFTTNARYEILAEISGGSFNDADLSVLIWLRFLKIYKEFEFINIDENKIGITGYSNGANIAHIMSTLNGDIKYIALVGTTAGLVKNHNSSKKRTYLNFPASRIIYSEHENFYFGSGLRSINKIRNRVYNEFKSKKIESLSKLLSFYYDNKYLIINGTKDAVVPPNAQDMIKNSTEEINELNKNISGYKNIILFKNNMDHNFSNENNITVGKFFNQSFNSSEQLDLNFKYKKNDKKNLNPKNFNLDLKKLYLDEFKRETNKQKINTENVNRIFKINDMKYSMPILLLQAPISIGDRKIIAKFYAQKIKDEIHGYFYEFENSSIKESNKSALFLHSKKDYDLELILKSIDSNKTTYLTILPGFSVLNSKFTTTGNLAKRLMTMNDSPTLAGLAFQAIKNLKKFSTEKYGHQIFEYYAFGVESIFLTLVNNSVLNNISKIELYKYIEIDDFFSDENISSIPAIIFVKGLNTIYDEIIKLHIDKRNIKIISYGNIDDYRVRN